MGYSLQHFSTALAIDSHAAYLHRVNQIPMLTLEEEQDLTRKLYYQNNLEAAKKLVLSHLRFVARIARGYDGYGLPQADLIQEGTIGLMKAVKRFNPEMGARLATFAIHWIKAEIHEFILRNWRVVKIATTKAQRKLFFNLRKASKNLNWLTSEEKETVANELNVSVAEVQHMEGRLNAYDESFNEAPPTNDAYLTPHFAPEQYLADRREDPARLLESENWETKRKEGLSNALQTLDERSRDIIYQRWLTDEKMTLQALADKYQISAERVRQLEKTALKVLRQSVE